MSLAKHVGRVTELPPIDGKVWRLSRLGRAEWDEFLEWARPRLPDPLEVAKKHHEGFPPHLQELLVKEAIAMGTEWLSLASRPVQGLLASPEGCCQLVWILLRKEHPEVTLDEALEIVFAIGAEELNRSIERTAGKAPAKNPPAPAE